MQRKACYLALGVTLDGDRDVLGIWFQEAEGAKFWLQVLNDLKQRGVQDVLIACVDGLKGFPDAIEAVFPDTWVQTCIVHLIRHSLRYVPRREREQVARDLRPIYTATDADVAREALEQFDERWGQRFPPITKSWQDAWEQVIPFLAFPPEVRRVIYTTDESVKCSWVASVVGFGRARVTPVRRAGRGDGSPAAQDCRLTASEPLPGGGTRARFDRRLALPVCNELAVGMLALLGERAFAPADLPERVGACRASGAFAAAA